MLRIPLLFLFSFRLLVRGRFTFLLLVAAVAFGLGLQIPNAANLNGYSRELLNQGMKRATGHVLITSPNGTINERSDVLRKVESMAVVRHTAPRLVDAGFVVMRGSLQPVRLQFVDVGRENRATGLCGRVARGQCIQAGDSSLLLGWEIAAQAAVAPGNEIVLAIPTRDGKAISRVGMRVAGILKGGGAFQEDKDIVLPEEARSRIYPGGPTLVDDATSILVFGSDSERAREYRDKIASELPNLTVNSWQDASGFVAQAIEGNRRLTWISRVMVTCAVLVPVLALLYIHVNGERRQIGALRAVGMMRIDIFTIYLLKAVVIVLVGELFGLVLAFGICRYFDAYPLFNSGGFVVRPLLSVQVVASSMVTVAAATILAGTWPAFRAAMTSPVKELSSP